MATEQQNLSRWKASGSPLEWVRERDGDWDHDDWTTLLSMLQRGKYWPMRPDEVGRLLEEVRDAHFPPDGDWALHPNQPRHRVTLTCELSRGGEGAVWETDDPAVLVKVYFKTPSEQHVEKLRHMVEHPPKDPERSSGHVSIAWPQALFARDGQVIGFTMPRGVGAVDLQHVMTPKWRDRQFPDATFALPLLLAYNLSLAVERTHAGGYVLGDIKPQNILCNPEGKVTLIDCDSAQVDTGRGRVFPASACTPEYTPPELINARTLATLKPDQDNFSLAVLLFQLLSVVNAHPFQGRWSGAESDRPSTPEEGIARGYYVLDASNAMQPPGVLKLAEVLPESTLKMFSQAFINGHSQPASRPAAGYWRAEMFSLIQQTRQLDRRCHNGNPRHVFPKPGPCPWCNSKSKLFGPYVENYTKPNTTLHVESAGKVSKASNTLRSNMTVEEKVIAIVAEQMGVDKSAISPSTSFLVDLNTDSLDTVELVMELEDEFGISIPDDRQGMCTTVGMVIDYVKSNQNSSGSPKGVTQSSPGSQRISSHSYSLGKSNSHPTPGMPTAEVILRWVFFLPAAYGACFLTVGFFSLLSRWDWLISWYPIAFIILAYFSAFPIMVAGMAGMSVAPVKNNAIKWAIASPLFFVYGAFIFGNLITLGIDAVGLFSTTVDDFFESRVLENFPVFTFAYGSLNHLFTRLAVVGGGFFALVGYVSTDPDKLAEGDFEWPE